MTTLSKLHKLALAASALALFGAPMAANAAIKIAGTPKVSFFAVGTVGALDIEGKTTSMTVTDDGTNLVFSVPMATVKTDIDTRDEHMLEAIGAAQYPNAILTFKKADVKWPTESGKKESGSVAATFNVHGKDQPVTVTYTNSKTSTGWTVSAKFQYNTATAGIGAVSYMGIGVDENQSASVKVDLIDG